MKRIALTGNMGSGKSYVGHLIEGFGVFVLDIDEVAADVRKTREPEILAMFDVKNAQALADIIFRSTMDKQRLEQFLYPYMLVEMEAFFNKHSNEKCCFVQVPLLFEKEWEIYFDEIWCVVCSQKVALKRLKQYRHIDEKSALLRLAHQDDIQSKMKRSSHIIHNNEKDDVFAQIKMLLEKEGYHV